MNSHELIDQYIAAILTPQLQDCKLSLREIATVTTDVRSRLGFLLSVWRDHSHSRTLLIPGIEEATFYQPTRTPLWVRALVVLAVRNSLLEDFHASPVNKIPDDAIPSITAAAAKALASIDHLKFPHAAAHQADAPPDSLPHLSSLYPIAWKALAALSQLGARNHSYPPEQVLSPPALLPPNTPQEHAHQGSTRATVTSGASGEITPQLREQLDAIATGQIQAFFAPSFKFITRNPGLLFYVVNFVLAHGGSVVTLNYYLKNGFVSARKQLLKPPHSVDESWVLLLRREGIDRQHAMVLQQIETQFNER